MNKVYFNGKLNTLIKVLISSFSFKIIIGLTNIKINTQWIMSKGC